MRLVIRGGQTVSAGAMTRADIAIEDGAILGVLPPGTALPYAQLIEAHGLVVLPGLVDVHCHLRDFRQAHKEDFTSGTAAAAAGGFTSVVAQPNTDPPMFDPDTLDRARAMGSNHALVDFGLSALVTPAGTPSLSLLREHGALAFDVVLADAPREWLMREPAALFLVLEEACRLGVPVAVYTADQGLVDLFTERSRASGVPSVQAFLKGRPGVVEGVGVAIVLEVARGLGVRLLIRQVTSPAALALLRNAKAAGWGDLWVEANPHHLFLSVADAEVLGPWGKVIPPLRSQEDVAVLWEGLFDGTVDLVGTDHAPHTVAERHAVDYWSIPAGFPALETTLPLFTEAVAKGQPDFPRLARWLSEAPARFIGLYPRKGSLLPGSDADLVLVDPAAESVLTSGDLRTRAGWTPFEGRRVRGRVVMTLVRGVPVFSGGDICVGPGFGQFLSPPVN